MTIAAAGSEGSANTVITKEEGMLKRGAKGEAIRRLGKSAREAIEEHDLEKNKNAKK